MKRLARAALILAGPVFFLLLAACASTSADRSDDPREKLAVLEDILRAKNDNDPRLDSAFNGLSPGDKAAFRERYRKLPAEARNERGTIVYLLGKNPGSDQDWRFFLDVVEEPPCLSLSDCSKSPDAEDPQAGGDEVTLAYPSLVALRQAHRALKSDPLNKKALAVIAAGKASRTPAVARMARRLAAGESTPKSPANQH